MILFWHYIRAELTSAVGYNSDRPTYLPRPKQLTADQSTVGAQFTRRAPFSWDKANGQIAGDDYSGFTCPYAGFSLFPSCLCSVHADNFLFMKMGYLRSWRFPQQLKFIGDWRARAQIVFSSAGKFCTSSVWEENLSLVRLPREWLGQLVCLLEHLLDASPKV